MVSGLLLIYGLFFFAGLHVRTPCVRAWVRKSKFCVCLGVCVGLGGGGGENLGKEGNVSFIILVSPLNVMLTILHLI